MTDMIKYLNDYSKKDIPKQTPKKPLIYKQKVHNKDYYHQAFGKTQTIDDIWSTIHVFTYYSMKANKEVLLLGPVVLEYTPKRLFGFPMNKTDIKTNLEAFVELNQATLEQENIEDAKKALHEQIVSGGMPWENNQVNAIYTQNHINHALSVVSPMIPGIDGDKIRAITLKDAFNRIYKTA